MQSDFEFVVGCVFIFCVDWGLVDCMVLMIELQCVLFYIWVVYGFESVVMWMFMLMLCGMLLWMEQVGFCMDQEQVYCGVQYGWVQFFVLFEQVLVCFDFDEGMEVCV